MKKASPLVGTPNADGYAANRTYQHRFAEETCGLSKYSIPGNKMQPLFFHNPASMSRCHRRVSLSQRGQTAGLPFMTISMQALHLGLHLRMERSRP